MKTVLVALMLMFLVKDAAGSPVGPSTVVDRVQQLEGATELQYEFSNNLDTRLAVLERFVAGLLRGNDSDVTLSNDTLSKTDFGSLKEQLGQQLSQTTNDTLPVLYRNAATRAAPGTHVAFHAYVRISRVFSPNEVIVYDMAEMNYGSSYTAHDGIFDAPVTGVYVFTWTISTSQYNLPITTHLIVDGSTRGILSSDSDYNRSSTSGSGSHPATGVVVTNVQAGEHVFIRTINPSGHSSPLESDNLVRSTFSGWLLF